MSLLPVQFGAACGLLVGHGVRALVSALGSPAPASLSLYATVGAAAFLAGSVRYKAAAVCITLESTGAWSLTVPITIAGVPRRQLGCREILASDRMTVWRSYYRCAAACSVLRKGRRGPAEQGHL